MGRLRVLVGRLLFLAALACAVAVGLTALRVRAAVVPPRTAPSKIDFGVMGLAMREVRFPAVDGVELVGWSLAGQPGRPPIVLCHDWGGSKETMLPLAIRLADEGFPLLLFDFRGHGESLGDGSTLGLTEKRDVIGALDYARETSKIDPPRLGLYGVGMGAYAAVLAAHERPAARVLVLDGLYPDMRFELLRRYYRGWGPDLPRAEFLPVGVFRAMTGSAANEPSADGVLADLTGRDVLFLAPEADPALSREIERMYRLVPVQPDVDGNLLTVSGGGGGLYGQARSEQADGVAEFFSSRLRPLLRAG